MCYEHQRGSRDPERGPPLNHAEVIMEAGAKGQSRMWPVQPKSVDNNRSRWPECNNMRQRSRTGLKKGGGGGGEGGRKGDALEADIY